jgi:hypothetical protein
MKSKFRVWDKKKNKYLDNSYAQAITNNGKLIIGDSDYYESFTNTNEDDYIVEYCTGYKSVNNEYIYVNDYVEYKLGLKMVRGRVVYDNFGYWIYEIRGGCMVFTQQQYTIIGNQNSNPVNE